MPQAVVFKIRLDIGSSPKKEFCDLKSQASLRSRSDIAPDQLIAPDGCILCILQKVLVFHDRNPLDIGIGEDIGFIDAGR